MSCEDVERRKQIEIKNKLALQRRLERKRYYEELARIKSIKRQKELEKLELPRPKHTYPRGAFR